jgi:hypothetical protein
MFCSACNTEGGTRHWSACRTDPVAVSAPVACVQMLLRAGQLGCPMPVASSYMPYHERLPDTEGARYPISSFKWSGALEKLIVAQLIRLPRFRVSAEHFYEICNMNCFHSHQWFYFTIRVSALNTASMPVCLSSVFLRNKASSVVWGHCRSTLFPQCDPGPFLAYVVKTMTWSYCCCSGLGYHCCICYSPGFPYWRQCLWCDVICTLGICIVRRVHRASLALFYLFVCLTTPYFRLYFIDW